MKKTTERSLAYARRMGWLAAKVEQWIPSQASRHQAALGEVVERFLGRGVSVPALTRFLVSSGYRETRGPRTSPGVRRDLFNFADAVVLDGAPGVLFVQSVAAGGDLSAHVTRYRADPDVRMAIVMALRRRNRVELWAWRKAATRKKDGSKGAPRWSVRRVRLELDRAEYFVGRGVEADG